MRSGTPAFSRADRKGSRPKDWKTKPIRSRRSRRRPRWSRSPSFWPSTKPGPGTEPGRDGTDRVVTRISASHHRIRRGDSEADFVTKLCQGPPSGEVSPQMC
jgi:hypothetical protein